MHSKNSYKVVNNPQLVPTDPEKPTFKIEGSDLLICYGDFMVRLNGTEARMLAHFIDRNMSNFSSFIANWSEAAKVTKSPCYAVEA